MFLLIPTTKVYLSTTTSKGIYLPDFIIIVITIPKQLSRRVRFIRCQNMYFVLTLALSFWEPSLKQSACLSRPARQSVKLFRASYAAKLAFQNRLHVYDLHHYTLYTADTCLITYA